MYCDQALSFVAHAAAQIYMLPELTRDSAISHAVLLPAHAGRSNLVTTWQVFPGRTEETYDMPLTRIVYIDASDFKEAKTSGYYGFCPQQPVMLK